MNAPPRRLMLWGSLGLALVASLVIAFRPRPLAVDFTAVGRGTLVVSVLEEGETRVRDVFVVSAPVTGRARRVEADVGDPVVGGETVIAQIEPIEPSLLDARSESEARASVQAAEAARATAASEFDRTRAELDFARNELERQRGLAERGAVSERDLDSAEKSFRTARAAMAKARAAVEERSHELDRARARLLSTTDPKATGFPCPCLDIRAPITGVVLAVHKESEGVVDAGEPLVELGDPRKLEIVVDLLSADAVRVEPGHAVLIEEWGGADVLHGRVRRIEPYGFTKVSALGIEEQRVNALIDLTDPPESWSRLGHGYRVEARILLWEGRDVLQLPLSALFRENDHWAVFVEQDGRARLREIEVGRRNSTAAEIRDGLSEGERVVLHPGERIVEGSRLRERG